MQTSTNTLLLLTTLPDKKSAKKLATFLVENKLAACVNIIPNLRSYYCWQGKLETSVEIQLLIKTKRPLLKKLERELKTLHPYVCPELLVIPVQAGSKDYLDWISQSLSKSE